MLAVGDYVRGPEVAQEVPQCANVADPRGLLVFSTIAQKFKLDRGGSGRYDMQDIYRCFKIRKRGES